MGKKVIKIHKEEVKKEEVNYWPTCGNCYHKGEMKEEGIKLCYRYPETLLLDSDGEPFTLRVLIEDDDRACGEFKPLN